MVGIIMPLSDQPYLISGMHDFFNFTLLNEMKKEVKNTQSQECGLQESLSIHN